MLASRILNNLRPACRCLASIQTLSHVRQQSSRSQDEDKSSTQTLGDMGSKYQIFHEKDSEVILDIYEDRNKYENRLLEEEEQEDEDPFAGLNLQRGLHNVYEIEDLLEVLKRENARDIFVASVPKEIKYVDYICIVTGKSQRHMKAIAQFVRKVYKLKMLKSDIIPKVEGENSKDWIALDLGNIALHIFSSEARTLYDLESLWSVGPQFDKEYNKEDPVAEMLEKHAIYLQDLQPAS